MQNVKVCEEEKCNGSDRTELRMAVPDGPVFIHTTMLVVFGIVSEDSENLFLGTILSVPSHGTGH